MRPPLSRRLQTQKLLLLGPVSLHGFRATNLSQEPTRHRSLPARTTNQALPSLHSRPSLAQHLGPCELGARLPHLRRLRTAVDPVRPSTLRRRQLGVALAQAVYALDATTIDLCLALLPWAKFRLKILSVTLLEKTPILQALSSIDCEMQTAISCKQLILFE